MDWQQIAALALVAGAALWLVRMSRRARNGTGGCGGCGGCGAARGSGRSGKELVQVEVRERLT